MDIVWYAYVGDRLKESTGEKRGKGVRHKVSSGTKLPPNWMQLLRDSVNKEELFAFLTNKVSEYSWPENKTVYITSGLYHETAFSLHLFITFVMLSILLTIKHIYIF